MDRRTLFAFVLIFLIIIGYPYLMKKFYGSPEEGAAADSTGTPVQTEAVETTPEAGIPDPVTKQEVPVTQEQVPASFTTAEQALLPQNAGTPQTVSVRTPLYHLEIDTRGGRITSWKGLSYDSYLGGPVELVPDVIPASGLDAVEFRGANLELGSVVFHPSAATVDVAEGSDPVSLTLSVMTAGELEIRKIFTFQPDVFGIELDYVVVAEGAAARTALGMTGAVEAVRFGWNQGIQPTERVQRMELPSLRSLARIGEDYHYKKRNGLKKSVEKVEGQWRGSVHFAGLQNRYFTVVGIVPQEQGEPIEGSIRLSGDAEMMAQSWAISVPGRRGVGDEIALAHLDLYIGPQEPGLLHAYGQGLEKTQDLGWKLFRPLSVGVVWCLEQMYRFIPNFGWIIIIFSIITKLAFYPLTRTSTQSMKKMQELQPKLKALQEKYKDDKEKLNQATMKLYQEEKVNPLAGCLPLLVQSPVFIALYQGLSHTISLRGQPFVFWITDLSQPDAITQLPFTLPFLGSDLNVLPILMSVAMYFQTKLTPSSGAGGQMAAMNTMMPLIMIFIFYNMPSGLVLYWLVNTLLQGYQTWKIHQTAPESGGKEPA